ncbi:HD domain-containing protein [Patescibacteria group bacterium]|nr:HD domain-containing protein [Patescibacteria group bacterium]
MNREEAFNLLKENLSNQNLIKHCLAVEAIMRALARHFKTTPTRHPPAEQAPDEAKWGLAGLLHDIDYDKVKDDLSQHSLVGAKILEDLGIDKGICQAVKVHNEAHSISPQTLMEKTLFVTDPLTGLIVAAALVLPSKKLADLTPENVLNRFKEKAFARGANREIIKKSEELLNLKLEEFIKIGLEAMQKIAGDLGL